MRAMKQLGAPLGALLLAVCILTDPGHARGPSSLWPVVVNVWPFVDANAAAWAVVDGGGSPVDAVVEGCSVCEAEQCDLSVGFGGSPGEDGETTLDAAVMDGDSMDVGAVGGLRRMKDAARAARLVLRHTRHSLLVGDRATAFALEMGLPGPEDLSTPQSQEIWGKWKQGQCQPNFRVRVTPNDTCGPYVPAMPMSADPGLDQGRRLQAQDTKALGLLGGRHPLQPAGSSIRAGVLSGLVQGVVPGTRGKLLSHDTITMVAIAKNGSIAAGSSTNGLTFHIPGRVGDAPIAGAGIYADSEVGGCGATGDGDVMMRFLPCFHVVELMRFGASPTAAAETAIRRIRRKYPAFQGALFAVNRSGHHGAAVNNWVLHYTVRASGMPGPEVLLVDPVDK